MKTNELRKKFLDFFAQRGHKVFASESLVPQDDPTVLFTSAGMNQFKPQFLGKITDFRRATSAQKCLRTDDLDKVGKTAGHHTFFEMLGNFSFGDYFKEEAISWAWEFVAGILKIPPDKLWISVYEDDAESYKIWSERINIPKGRILKLGQKENFWPSNVIVNGPNGPCGPCSEIFFDQGKNVGCAKETCSPVCSCGRFVEVWNLVFTQFNRRQDSSGKAYLEPLPQKNIDTGMGLERMAAVLQGVQTNFEIDIFKPIVREIEREAGSRKLEAGNAVYAIADHIRAVVFAITDGVLPSNEERGYVVRKLIRKAAWHGRSLGLEDKFLYKLVPVVTRVMGEAYPDLITRRENISQIVMAEEERFRNTLEDGLNILNNLIAGLKEKNIKQICGEEAFKLYDTYGFPVELTELIATGKGLSVDKEGFAVKMEEQKKRSKDKSTMKGDVFSLEMEQKLHLPEFRTNFIGYDNYEILSKIEAIIIGNTLVDSAEKGDAVIIVLDKTPFYAEQGGQIADTGKISAANLEVEVDDVKKASKAILHFGKITRGRLKLKDEVSARVDSERRLDIARNHTATHLLQSALREVLGTHIEQSGSWVGADGLRFDFTHFKPVTDEQLERIEELVNAHIRNNDGLNSEITDIATAKKKGALAFFGEKYEEKVRLVSVGEYSKELCGGIHLNSTGQIGVFIILNESSVAQGIRRIEAVTGRGAYSKIRHLHSIVKGISAEYKVPREKILDYMGELSQRIKFLDKEINKLKLDHFKKIEAQDLIDKADNLEGVKLIFCERDESVEILREYMDILKAKAEKNAFIILSSDSDSRSTVLIGVTQDLSKSMDAASSARFAAGLIAGSGGGRKDLAQAGSKDPGKLKLLKNRDNLFKIFKAAKI